MMSSGSRKRWRSSPSAARSSSFSRRSSSRVWSNPSGLAVMVHASLPRPGPRSRLRIRAEIETDDHSFGVREITDDLPERLGDFSNQGGDGQDLVVARQTRVLQQIDHLDAIAPRQVLLAELVQV